jgi:hypothetical protein
MSGCPTSVLVFAKHLAMLNECVNLCGHQGNYTRDAVEKGENREQARYTRESTPRRGKRPMQCPWSSRESEENSREREREREEEEEKIEKTTTLAKLYKTYSALLVIRYRHRNAAIS